MGKQHLHCTKRSAVRVSRFRNGVEIACFDSTQHRKFRSLSDKCDFAVSMGFAQAVEGRKSECILEIVSWVFGFWDLEFSCISLQKSYAYAIFISAISNQTARRLSSIGRAIHS